MQLDRVENKRLYKQFQAQKEEVEGRMKSNNVNLPVTRRLFHGTSHDVCEKTYKGGFNRRHAGKNGKNFTRSTLTHYYSNFNDYYLKKLKSFSLNRNVR